MASANLDSTWISGHALIPQYPRDLSRIEHSITGASVTLISGETAYFHIPLPTPTIIKGQRSQLHTVYLLYSGVQCTIGELFVRDGETLVQVFDGLALSLRGQHLGAPDAANTFQLASPHEMKVAVGLSFSVIADSVVGLPQPQIVVEAAGGDFMT